MHIGCQTTHVEKLRDGCSLALNDRSLMNKRNNQPAIDESDRLWRLEEAAHGGSSEWGDVVPLLRATI